MLDKNILYGKIEKEFQGRNVLDYKGVWKQKFSK